MISAWERMEQLQRLLCAHAYRFNDETDLQDGIEQVLLGAGIEYQREMQPDRRNRFDFVVEGIVMEVKIKGSLQKAAIQCHRYQKLPDVRGVMLLATNNWARTMWMPPHEGIDFLMVKLNRRF
jgi:hypothetical protein